MLEFNKETQTNVRLRAPPLLIERQDAERTDTLLERSDFIDALYKQACDPKSWIGELSDLEPMKAIMDRIKDDLTAQTTKLSALGTLKQKDSAEAVSLESAISNTIRTLDKLLERWQRRISDTVMTKLLLRVIICASSNALVAETLLLISHFLFSIEEKPLFYVVRAYMEHWNSYNNKRIGLDSLLQTQPRDLKMEFNENSKPVVIESTYNELKTYFDEGLPCFEIASGLCEDHHHPYVELAVLVKLRFVLCPPEQLSDLVYCVLLSFQILNRIEVGWFRAEETRKQIPEIFMFPPDYENIFLEFLELFSLKDCDSSTHLHILEVVKAILETEQGAEEGSDLFMSLAKHFTYIRRIINDINNALQGRQPQYLPLSTVSNKAFVKVVLQLLCLCNVEIEDIMQVSFEVAEKVAFSEDFDRETVAVACLVLTYQQLNDSKQEHLIDKLIEAASAGKSTHITSYLLTLASFFNHNNHYGQAHRRDSTALARKLVESQLFEKLCEMVTYSPLKTDSIAFRTLMLIENICSEAPLLTDKIATIIDQFLSILSRSEFYPSDEPETLVVIPSFLHHVSLKEGNVRNKVMTSGVLKALIGIYSLDKFVKILSLNHHAEPIAQFFGSINRFLINIPACRQGILEGLLEACQRIIKEMLQFEKELDMQVEGKPYTKTVRYQDVTAKINNIMRLIIKISGNLNADCTELYSCTEMMFKLKYLNVHNPAENHWMSHNARLVEDPKAPGMKLEAICQSIEEIIKETVVEEYDIANEGEVINWKIFVNLNRLDRLINLARTSNDMNPLYSRIDMFPVIEKLDAMRMSDITTIAHEISELQLPLNSDELRDFLLHTLKTLAEKKANVGLSLQYTLKRLLNEACKARSFEINEKIARSVTLVLQHLLANPPQCTLKSIYITKLKFDHVQFMLELIPMVMHNYTQFPCNFTMFSYLYQEDVDIFFQVCSAIIAKYWHQVEEQGDNLKGFTELLRNELLKKLVIVLQAVSTFQTIEDQEEDDNADQTIKEFEKARADCVRFVMAKMLKGFMKLALEIPNGSDCSTSSQMNIKHVIVTVFASINRLATMRNRNLSKCKIPFTIDSERSLTETEFRVKCQHMLTEFHTVILERLHTWQCYEMPMVGLYLEHSSRKLFKWKECARLIYNKACAGVIDVAKHLFHEYEIDLGIRHPKTSNIEYEKVNLRTELNKLNIDLTSVIYVMEVATQNKWFGSGELLIPSTSICELVKLVEHIIMNSADMLKEQNKPLEAIDPMVRRILVMVETYKTYQLQRKAESINQRKREQQEKELIKLEPIKARRVRNKKRKEAERQKTESKVVKEQKQAVQENKEEVKEERQRRPKTKKIKEKKHKKPSQLSVAVQSMLHSLLSQPLPLIDCSTLRQVMLLLSDTLKSQSKKFLRIRMDQLAPLIVQAKLRDRGRTGLIEDLSTLVIRLFSNQHVRLDVEASIKRIFYEIEKDAKDGWFLLSRVLNEAKLLTDSFGEEPVTTSLRQLCQFRKGDELVTLSNRQVWDCLNHEADKYSVRLRPDVDLTTISMPSLGGLKNRRKSSHKQHGTVMVVEEPNKYLEYVPDGPLLAVLRTILEQMIQDILTFIENRVTNKELRSNNAFDFNNLAKVLRVVVRESSILIPFITRFKCRKTLNSCLASCSEQTRRITEELLVKRDKQTRSEPCEITFMSLLLRLFTTVSFKNLQRLVFLLCLDNYVLCRSPKNVVQSTGYWIRMKVLEELGGGGCGWIRNLAYLSLLMNLLDIKQFSRQCIQEGTISYLHKQFILTRQSETADFFYAQLPCILNPLTVLHNVNLAFQVNKQKPTVVRGKHTAHQVKHQLISKNFLKRNNFTSNWIYQSGDQIMRADYSRHFRREGQFDDEHFYFNSEDGTEEYEDADASSLSQIEPSDEMSGSVDGDQIEMEQDDIDESDMSSGDGWTSEHGAQGFSIGREGASESENPDEMDAQHEIDGDFDDRPSNLSDILDEGGITDEASSMIIQQVFGNDNSSQSGNSAIQQRLFSDLQGNPKIFNPEVRRLAEQIEQLLVTIFVRKDESNPIYQKVRGEELFQLCESVDGWVAPGQRTSSSEVRRSNDITSLLIEFKEPKVIFDDTNIVLPTRWRRRGELLQRPRMITASSVQVDNNEVPMPAEAARPHILIHQHHQPNQDEHEEMEQEDIDEEGDDDQDDGGENQMDDFHGRLRLLIQDEQDRENEESEGNLGNIEELLQGTNFDPNQFRLLPREVQADILHNIMNPTVDEIHRHVRYPQQSDPPAELEVHPRQGDPIVVEQHDHQSQAPPPQPELEPVEVAYDRRRKLSHDYIKKIAKDPREILLKQKKQQKLYLCENEFITALMSLLYQDEVAHNEYPFALLKSLCANPLNETRFLATFMIILKHPNLIEEKIAHKESLDTFPMTVLRQKNGEIGTDYLNMGYAFISLKILHILSNLSRTNSSAMLEATHNKVSFLAEWYWLEEKPYYVQLIQLLDAPAYRESSFQVYLTETIFNIIRHYCLKYIHDKEQSGTAEEFRLRLSSNEVRLLCTLLETFEETEHISEVIMLLCIDESNLNTFISTLNVLLEGISKDLINDLKSRSNDDKFIRGHLKKILSIVYDMFQSEYTARLEKTQQRSAVKNQLLRSFKSLIECRSLQQLCHDWIEFMCDNTVNQYQLAILTEVLECFFIIYKITMAEEEQRSKRRNISALGELDQPSAKKDGQTQLTKEFSLEAQFNYICLKGRPVVNSILKQKLSDMKKMRRKELPSSIFDDPMIYILSKNSSLIDYDNKRTMFKMEIKNIKSREKGHHPIDLVLSREHVLDQSMNEIMARSAPELKGKLHIQFQDEEGEDAGGLTREWFSLLSKQMFNPNYAIFQPSSTGNTYQPSPKSYINPQHLTFFKFVGRVVGKAMHDGFIMQAFFTPAFYKHILGLPITYRDMEEEDYEFYKNMVWLIENDITDVFELTFSYDYDEFGELKVKDLKPNGRSIPVTEQNKLEYIQMLCYAKMATAVQKQIEAFLEGFHQLIPPQLVSIFDSKELELMISGLPTIDIQDLKENTELVNYDKHDNVIVWLFEVLQGFDSNLRASFLQFVTGTSRLPSEGFKGLRGVNGPQKFNIHKDFDSSKLPRAHTCFNQLDLPNYPTKEVLIEKLTVAVTEGKEGFGMI